MSIAEFIQTAVLRPRLRERGCLVVYDAGGRYRQVCQGLAAEKFRVIDVSAGSIENREDALLDLKRLGDPKPGIEGLLIYVPGAKPDSDQARQLDPFAIYAACGAVFPDGASDEYEQICLKAKPDHMTEIRRLFAESPGGPSFSVIDAVGGGLNWPQLRATFKVDSPREILIALMAPSVAQGQALKAQEGWVQEARDFLRASLAMAVKTKAKTWNPLAEELWRFVLFSEFAFGVKEALPPALENVPHAPPEARPVVEDVCERLRGEPKFRATYIERAEKVEVELNLAELCEGADRRGGRATFPFEERGFLRDAIAAVGVGDFDLAKRVLGEHGGSVWVERGDSQAQWDLLRAGLGLAETCDDLERQLVESSRSQAELLDFYLGSLREADRLQREFEQAVGDYVDAHGVLDTLVAQARGKYGRLMSKVQDMFVKHLETSGWPPAGRVSNADVFDRFVAIRLQERGRKVAFLMVDALRYELGMALEKLLSEDGPVEIHAAYAQLPTITPVGMASLLPGARADLSLALEGDALVPKLSGASVTNVTQRMDVLKRRFGSRFDEMQLGEFVRSKRKVAETVDLMVLRSTEIDSQLENNPETTLSLIPGTLKLIRAALSRLRSLGFEEAVIATDHGFFLNAQAEAGDVCAKPQGNWAINAHDRLMLGHGNGDSHSLALAAEKLGIRGDFAQAALPRSMAPYRAGHLYFHGGASLAEAVVPVLVAKLGTARPAEARKPVVRLEYKHGTKRITTQTPVVELTLIADDMFLLDTTVEVLLETQDTKGVEVGQTRLGGDVNPASSTVMLTPGRRVQVRIRMGDEFRGKFVIRAVNPTTLSAYSELRLETDYTE